MDKDVIKLIQYVTRTFYGTECALIVDAIIFHSVLSEEDLLFLLKMNRKETRAVCNQLVNSRMVIEHFQKEVNDQQRVVTRTYFFIDPCECVDAIKWKLHSVINYVKVDMSTSNDMRGYVCPRCRQVFDLLEAISMLNADKTAFICDTCGTVLVEESAKADTLEKQQRLERLMSQFNPIINYLKLVDQITIEQNTFESLLLRCIPAQSSSSAMYSISDDCFRESKITTRTQDAHLTKLHPTMYVLITSEKDINDDEKEKFKKDAMDKEMLNKTLPTWHYYSTIMTSEAKISNLDSAVGAQVQTKEGGKKTDTDTNFLFAYDNVEEKPFLPLIENNESDKKEKNSKDALAAYYENFIENDSQSDEESMGDILI